MVGSKGPAAKTAPRARTDGRRSLLVYLEPDLIKDLKRAALDDEANVYEIVEAAAREWLKRRDKKSESRSVKRQTTERG